MTTRIILVLCFYLLKIPLSFAQENNNSIKNDPVKSTLPAALNTYKSSGILATRAIVLPYLIGNDAGIATSVGVEYIFFKHHSIGVDWFMHFAGGSHDGVYDTTGVLHDVGSVHSSTEKAVFINYRYYFNYKKLKAEKGVTVYLSPYFRYGLILRRNDPLYKVDYVFQKERTYAEGILLGAMVGVINGCPKCKIDFNIGPYKKEKDITSTYLENGTEKTRFEKQETTGLRIGVFFAYLLY